MGARVGVRVGEVVRVADGLGLTVTVRVGDDVLVGDGVLVCVSLGTTVHEAVVAVVNCVLQAAKTHAPATSQITRDMNFLCCNGEE